MKRLLNILFLSAASFMAAGCNDFLTQNPRDELSSLGYWSTENDVTFWMNGVYNGIYQLTADLRWYGEARSDNVFPTTYGDGPEFQMNAISSSMGRSDWTKFYTVIARCNIAIAELPGMSAVPESKKEQFLAECHGIRALMYFYIVRIWGGCPLILKPWDFQYDTRYNKRSSVEAVALAIGGDIKQSVAYFGNSGSRQASAHYFNLAGAYALQMDFLTWRGEYGEVLNVYGDFIAKYPTKKLSQPGANFTATANNWKASLIDPAATSSTESIFSIVFNAGNNGTSVYSSYAESIAFSNSNASFALGRNTYLLMVQDLDDVRLGGAVEYPTKEAQNLIPSNAPVYNTQGGGSGSNDNVQKVQKFVSNTDFMTFAAQTAYHFPCPIYRYADVLLLYAEALNRTGDGENAIKIVNDIRASRGSKKVFDIADYPQQLGGSTTSRERLIMDERQLEFYGEPKRWFDLMRLDWGYEVIDAHIAYLQTGAGQAAVGFGSRDRLLFPIAQKNLTNNPQLVQNPGY